MKKNERKFESADSLKPVINVVNESFLAINDKKRTIQDSEISVILSGVVGAGIGGAASFAALYGLGVTGLSAAGITSGLATAGSIIGGGMVAGIFTLAAPIAILGAAGAVIASKSNANKFIEEKSRLYIELIKVHDGIIKSLEEEVDATKERLEYLNVLNTLLTRAKSDLKNDLILDGKIIDDEK